MSYVIYKPTTWRIFKFPSGRTAVYDTETQAKAQFTKLSNAGTIKPDEWKIDTYADYNNNEPMVMVRNCLSGKDVQIRMSERGGCCDPSTEHYHCM